MSITIKDLYFTYGSDTPWALTAVNGVNLIIGQGEIVGLVGHTGSGKSSLAQLICGLLAGDSGEIHLGDLQLVGNKKLKAMDLVKRIGMVFQYPEHQLFEESVALEIAYGPVNLGWPEDKIKVAVKEIAEHLGLDDDFLNRSPIQLSGGEKRKVALASVLVMNPPVLVLDEPFVGLDCLSKADLTELLLAWQKTNNTTIICISHDMDQLALFCNRLLVMDHGRLVLDEEITRAFAKVDLLAQAGILQPVPKEILLALAAKGCGLDTMPITIGGACKSILAWRAAKGGDGCGR